MEPMLLRVALAQTGLLRDGAGFAAEVLASPTAFQVELVRGDAVHRREQARFLLDIDHDTRQRPCPQRSELACAARAGRCIDLVARRASRS